MFSCGCHPNNCIPSGTVYIGYTITLVSEGNSSTLTTADRMITLQGLNPFTSYTISVSASTRVGPGPSTPSVIVTTPQAGRLHMNFWREGRGGEGEDYNRLLREIIIVTCRVTEITS